MIEQHPLPEVAAATERYAAAPSDERLRDIAVASAPWNFTPAGVAAGADRIVTQRLWDDERHRRPNVIRREIAGGAHFPWIERPDAVGDAFAAFAQAVAGA